MSLFSVIFTNLFLWWEGFKGRRPLQDVSQYHEEPYKLTGLSVDGYEIEISCRKQVFQQRYRCSLFPAKRRVSYWVVASVSADAPEALRHACRIELHYPAQYHGFLLEEVQKKLAIQAYLDLLASYIKLS